MDCDQTYVLLDPSSNLSAQDLGKFWRDQSVLYYKLEGDNILIKVTRKQIKWPQNMSLETLKLKYTTLLINILFSFYFFYSLWVGLLYEGRYLDLYYWSCLKDSSPVQDPVFPDFG